MPLKPRTRGTYRGPMPRTKRYYVYIMASRSRVLCVGITGFLMPRALQHKTGESGFTARYHIYRLVYYEVFKYVNRAIARETEIKAWRREKKIALIESMNPAWEDLSAGWGQPTRLERADSSSSLRSSSE